MSKPLAIARLRASAWLRVIEAVTDMLDALDYRIWRADLHDTHLEADCRVWRELARALAEFLKQRNSK